MSYYLNLVERVLLLYQIVTKRILLNKVIKNYLSKYALQQISHC